MKAYSTVILCGGKSSRMKKDKALMDWGGKPLALYLADRFPSCSDVFLSVSSPSQFHFPLIRQVPDEIPGCGPLGGLCASLKAAENPLLFVTTCDAPLVDQGTADTMVSLLEEYDAVVPRTKDGIHPLNALYRTRILPKARDFLERGDYKIRFLLDSISVRYVDAQLLPFREATLTNLNTPEELKAFLSSFPEQENLEKTGNNT